MEQRDMRVQAQQLKRHGIDNAHARIDLLNRQPRPRTAHRLLRLLTGLAALLVKHFKPYLSGMRTISPYHIN